MTGFAEEKSLFMSLTSSISYASTRRNISCKVNHLTKKYDKHIDIYCKLVFFRRQCNYKSDFYTTWDCDPQCINLFYVFPCKMFDFTGKKFLFVYLTRCMSYASFEYNKLAAEGAQRSHALIKGKGIVAGRCYL